MIRRSLSLTAVICILSSCAHVIHNEPVSNKEALVNPASLRQFENLETLHT